MADHYRTGAFNWEDVRYFLALARLGSLASAARALRVNHATVARRIRALEVALGRVLFDRRPDGYGLTHHGQAMLKKAVAMEEIATAIPQSMDNFQLQGSVRVTMVRSLADAFLVNKLSSFYRDYPGIALEILTDTRVVSLARREADIALRLGRPKDSSLVGRKIAQIRYAFYASSDVAVQMTHGNSVPLIAYDKDSKDISEAIWLEKNLASSAISFRSNSNLAQAAAARAGAGFAMLPRYLGDFDPGLKEVSVVAVHPPRDLWLLTPRELSRVPRIRAVITAITAAITAHQKSL